MVLDEQVTLASKVHCTGVLEALVCDAVTGTLIETRRVENKIVQNGTAFLIDRLFGNTVFNLSLFNIGTGITPVSATDTEMQASVFQTTISTSIRTGFVTGIVSCFIGSTQANGNTISEASTRSGDGVMFSHAVFPGIVKTTSVTITFLWTFTVTAS